MISANQDLVAVLVEKILVFIQPQADSDSTPSFDALNEFVCAELNNMGVSLSETQSAPSEKVAVLLKPNNELINKRMRELAGIPHKDNYV